jgi:hypothetical protein
MDNSSLDSIFASKRIIAHADSSFKFTYNCRSCQKSNMVFEIIHKMLVLLNKLKDFCQRKQIINNCIISNFMEFVRQDFLDL